jgi:hypothetical protein
VSFGPVEQKPSGTIVLPSPTVTQGGAGLMACSYGDAMSSAQQVLQYLDHMKSVVDDQPIPFQFFTMHVVLLTCSSHLCIALTVKLEATNKALSEEKASRQIADQELWAVQESNFALTPDLQVVWTSTATLKEDLEAVRVSSTTTNQELSSKSAAFDELGV